MHLDKIKLFFEGSYDDIEKNMTGAYVVKTDQDVTFYNEAIDIFNKYKATNQELLKKISTCQMEKGNIKLKEKKWV